jgi:hypothetical protein
MNEEKSISQLANKALQDRLIIQKLSDKIYELMLQDLRLQKDRSKNYRV